MRPSLTWGMGVEFTTMSKSYSMAGWRVGFCCGNAEMIHALHTIKGYYDYGIFQPIQIAAIVAMRHCDGLRKSGWGRNLLSFSYPPPFISKHPIHLDAPINIADLDPDHPCHCIPVNERFLACLLIL